MLSGSIMWPLCPSGKERRGRDWREGPAASVPSDDFFFGGDSGEDRFLLQFQWVRAVFRREWRPRLVSGVSVEEEKERRIYMLKPYAGG